MRYSPPSPLREREKERVSHRGNRAERRKIVDRAEALRRMRIATPVRTDIRAMKRLAAQSGIRVARIDLQSKQKVCARLAVRELHHHTIGLLDE